MISFRCPLISNAQRYAHRARDVPRPKITKLDARAPLQQLLGAIGEFDDLFAIIQSNLKRTPAAWWVPFSLSVDKIIFYRINYYSVQTQFISLPHNASARTDEKKSISGGNDQPLITGVI